MEEDEGDLPRGWFGRDSVVDCSYPGPPPFDDTRVRLVVVGRWGCLGGVGLVSEPGTTRYSLSWVRISIIELRSWNFSEKYQ